MPFNDAIAHLIKEIEDAIAMYANRGEDPPGYLTRQWADLRMGNLTQIPLSTTTTPSPSPPKFAYKNCEKKIADIVQAYPGTLEQYDAEAFSGEDLFLHVYDSLTLPVVGQEPIHTRNMPDGSVVFFDDLLPCAVGIVVAWSKSRNAYDPPDSPAGKLVQIIHS